jgi:serine protease Do
MKPRELKAKPAPSRLYHLLIFGGAAIVLTLGGLWRGGVEQSEGETPASSAIEILRQEVSGVQSVLRRNELEVMRDAMADVVTGIAPSVVALRPQAETLPPLRNIPVYGRAGSPAGSILPSNAEAISGLVIDRDGYILASASVVNPGPAIVVTRNGETTDADLISSDESLHLALLKLREIPPSVRPLSPDKTSELKTGEWIVAQSRLGTGAGARALHFLQSIYTSPRGETAGIYVNPPTSSGFVLPISRALDAAIVLRSRPQRETRAWAGFETQDLSSDLKEYFGAASGALISTVEMDSPAAKAGLQPMDIIETVDDKTIADAATLMNLIRQSARGTRIVLGVRRNSRLQTRDLTVSEFPGAANPQAPEGSLIMRLGQSPGNSEGAVILSIYPQIAANTLGIASGDVILAIDGRPLRTADQFWSIQRSISAAKGQLWTIRRGDKQFFVAVKERILQP